MSTREKPRAMTVGDLRKALDGVSDHVPLIVEAESISDPDLGEIDTLRAVVVAGRFMAASPLGPERDSFVLFADGVPEGTYRDCGAASGEEHKRFCCNAVEDILQDIEASKRR